MKGKIVVSVTSIMIIYIGIHLFIAWNIGVYLHVVSGSEIPYAAVAGVILVLGFAYMIARAAHTRLPGMLIQLLRTVGAYWMGIMEYALLLFPVADLVAWGLRLAGMNLDASILWTGSITAALLASILARGVWNARTPIVRSHQISVQKSMGDRTSLKILAASDIHLGSIVGKRHLERLVQIAEERRPDLIVLPGDIIDDEIEPYIRQDMAAVMRRLRAPLGVYAVLGNHEYYGGDLALYVEQLQKGGVRVLLDEVVQAEGLVIAGRKDLTAEGRGHGGRKSLSELLGDAAATGIDTAGAPLILLEHQPYHLERAEAAGFDLMFSGHTHRGQMAPNHWITRRLYELDWGYKRKNQLHVFVSSGFGTWGPPIRIGSRSEVIEAEVSFASAAAASNIVKLQV